jgi:aryl-alcohol dehydrogenase-like predicted oxidoreductase
MQYRKLGRNGPNVSAIGLGCMSIGIADTYTSSVRNDDDAVALIHHALKLGITMLDTADIYGNSERQVGKALAGKRDKVLLATKFGFTSAVGATGDRAVNGSEGYVKQACEARSSGWASMRSISTTCIASIRRCRSKRPSVPCPNWCKRAR